MHTQFIAIASITAMFMSMPALAAGEHSTHPSQTNTSKPAEGSTVKPSNSLELTPGEIKKVDPKTGKITLKHGEIKNIQMPPMTMVFSAKDAAILKGLNQGDNVLFAVDQNMAITHIEKR